MKLANTRCHYDLQKYSFAVVNIRNSLHELFISADSVDRLKNRLDRFRPFGYNQDVLFDYKVDLTGISNRSLTNMDDIAV